MTRTRVERWLPLLGSLLAPYAAAAQLPDARRPPPIAAPAPAPDERLLEFLGSFETADGRWIDPGALDREDRRPRPESRVPGRPPTTVDPKATEAPDDGSH
ncbi:MAG: hypothetical protein B7Z66_08730 [Chromatiales bacterium 21-64-14]|nr:MAG: hypothetical protein B7Z66_08730 [Chromatiales bacterium 21-64-14]